jgi:hypothetical protein
VELRQLANSVTAACGPEFVKKRYLISPDVHPTWGNCYVACEALYYLGAKEAGFKPHYVEVGIRQCNQPLWVNHWYLRNPATDAVLDPTVKQFNGVVPDYAHGTCCGFLTKRPSKRCKLMLARIKEHHD